MVQGWNPAFTLVILQRSADMLHARHVEKLPHRLAQVQAKDAGRRHFDLKAGLMVGRDSKFFVKIFSACSSYW